MLVLATLIVAQMFSSGQSASLIRSVAPVSPQRAEQSQSLHLVLTVHLHHQPWQIANGSDGNIWVDTLEYPSKLIRISPTGRVRIFSNSSGLYTCTSLLAAADQKSLLCVNGGSNIAKISLNGTLLAKYPLPYGDTVNYLSTGLDGSIWGVDDVEPLDKVTRLWPDGTISTYTIPVGPNVFPYLTGIATGADGAEWATEVDVGSPNSSIDRLDPVSGAVTTFPLVLGGPSSIASGPDGNLWFAFCCSPNVVGRMTTQGTLTPISGILPYCGSYPSMTRGSDGAMYFLIQGCTRIYGGDFIAKVTMSGDESAFFVPNKSNLQGMVLGPDGNLWVTDRNNQQVDVFSSALVTQAMSTKIPR